MVCELKLGCDAGVFATVTKRDHSLSRCATLGHFVASQSSGRMKSHPLSSVWFCLPFPSSSIAIFPALLPEAQAPQRTEFLCGSLFGVGVVHVIRSTLKPDSICILIYKHFKTSWIPNAAKTKKENVPWKTHKHVSQIHFQGTACLAVSSQLPAASSQLLGACHSCSEWSQTIVVELARPGYSECSDRSDLLQSVSWGWDLIRLMSQLILSLYSLFFLLLI